MSETTAPFLMPCVDRSRFSTSWGQCQRKRFLEYHSVSGFGVRRKAQTLPLATGIQVHKILEGLLRLGETGSRAEQRKVIVEAVEGYRAEALDSGIFQLAQETNGEDGAKELLATVNEQASLIEGLAWAAVRCFLPAVWRDYTVVSIEQEEEYVLGCDCGLGEGAGTGDEHQQRECGGVVLMSRPDLIVRRNSDSTLCYVEFKTSGDVTNYAWREQFESNVQLALGVVGAEKRLGEEIPNCLVVGFNKGWRKKGYDSEAKAYDGPKRQDSPFCYTYKREANPPHWEEDYKTKWNYTDADGKGRTLKGKGYEKVALAECKFAQKPTEYTDIEFWVEAGLEEEEVQSQVVWLGPLPTTRYLVADLLEALTAEEKRWQERLFAVWEAAAAGPEALRSAMNVHVPQTWECFRWGKKCSYLPVCRRDEEIQGEDGKLKEGWQFRRPHHERELVMMKTLGVAVPKAFDEEEGE